MVASTIMLKNHTPLQIQARLHQALSTHISWIMYEHQPYADSFFEATGASEFPDLGYTYANWWASFGRHLETHANAHQDMADGLTKVISNFNTLDDQIPVTG